MCSVANVALIYKNFFHVYCKTYIVFLYYGKKWASCIVRRKMLIEILEK